jgi:hypothetical protein
MAVGTARRYGRINPISLPVRSILPGRIWVWISSAIPRAVQDPTGPYLVAQLVADDAHGEGGSNSRHWSDFQCCPSKKNRARGAPG